MMTNIKQPREKICDYWPEISFFGLFEGYDGVTCADFLKDHLVWFIIKALDFPKDPYEAISKGFFDAETHFLRIVNKYNGTGMKPLDISGSQAIIVLIVDQVCYMAQVGTSQAFLSVKSGQSIANLTQLSQNKVNSTLQEKNQFVSVDQNALLNVENQKNDQFSPRKNFGAPVQKKSVFNLTNKVVKGKPRIQSFQIQPDHDFIVLSSQLIDKFCSKQELVKSIWESSKANFLNRKQPISELLRESIKQTLTQHITDDKAKCSLLILTFKNFTRMLKHDLETYQRKEFKLKQRTSNLMVCLPEEDKILRKIQREILQDSARLEKLEYGEKKIDQIAASDLNIDELLELNTNLNLEQMPKIATYEEVQHAQSNLAFNQSNNLKAVLPRRVANQNSNSPKHLPVLERDQIKPKSSYELRWEKWAQNSRLARQQHLSRLLFMSPTTNKFTRPSTSSN